MLDEIDHTPNKKIEAVSKAVREIFNELPEGKIFYGWELKQLCSIKYPELKDTYDATFLREMRSYYKGRYELLSRRDSLYRKVKNDR